MSKIPEKLKIERAVIIAWLPVAIWMAVVFFFSAQPAEESVVLSGGLTSWLVNISQSLPIPEAEMHALHGSVRKYAHFLVYLVLGLLVARALAKSRQLNRLTLLSALLVCVLYAVSDEVHQLYVPGRSGQVSDVLLDSAGSAVGIAFFFWYDRHRKNRKNKKKRSISVDS